MLDLVEIPAGVSISTSEMEILHSIVQGASQKAIATEAGIPAAAIANLLRRKGVKKYVTELREARLLQLQALASETVAEVLEDKIAKAQEEGVRLADTSRKDPVTIANILSGIVKGEKKESETVANDPLANVYTQINLIQQGS